MNESTRMILVLTLIAMISGASLSLVYGLTEGVIRDNLARELHGSIFQVLPGAVDVTVIEARGSLFVEDDESTLKNVDDKDDEPLLLYKALDAAGKPVGFAYVAEETGYGGIIKVMIGVDDQTEQITGVIILDHTETPGIGNRIEDEKFRNQFIGRTVTDPISLGKDIEGITGATVSSRAVIQAVRKDLEKAIQAYKEAK